jgi:hypothetical protein
MVGCFLHHRLHCGYLAYIGGDDENLSPQISHQLGRRLKLADGSSGQGDVSPGVGQSQGHAQTQAPTASRDQGHPAIQSQTGHLKFIIQGSSSLVHKLSPKFIVPEPAALPPATQ